jgi:hypothetical protein
VVNFVKNTGKLKKLAIFVFHYFKRSDSKKLMKKIIISILVICTFFACKEEEQATREQATQSQEEYLAKNKLNIPKKGKFKELNPVQKKLVQDWLEFNTMYESMKLINASTRFAIVEDLGQLAVNIKAIEEKRFPADLDATQIRSRLLVLKTKALKLQDDATDENITNEFIEKEIVAMNTVFNAVCYQIQQASELNIDPNEILGNSLKKDSIKVDTPKQEEFKSTISEKSTTKKILQEIDPENN